MIGVFLHKNELPELQLGIEVEADRSVDKSY